MDGVVVVFEAEERRFARVIKVVAGADASGGRTAELLNVAASGRGVVPSCNVVWLPGRARRRGESWNVAVVSRVASQTSVAASGGGREA